MGSGAREKKWLHLLTLFVVCVAGPVAAQRDTTVGRTVVLDSLEPRAPARSLSELMTARFPGVLVWSSSGTVGTSSRILMRGPNTIFGDGAPLVVVDGMVVDANPASFLSSVGGQQVSRLDDLDPADIASIEVVDGANEGASFGTGAANGVLVITTRQGEVGPPRFRFTSTQGLNSDPHTFPASFTPGPGGLPQVNPLEDPSTSPFRSGYLRDYRAEVSGGWAPATYYLSAHWEGLGGVYGLPASEQARLSAAGTLRPETLNPSNLSRLNLRAGGQFAVADQVDVRISGGLLSSSLRLPSGDSSLDGILANGLLANTTGPSPWAAFPPGDLFQVLNTEDVLRLMGTVNAEWRPAPWASLDALAGGESLRQGDELLQRNGEGPADTRQGRAGQDTLRQGDATYRVSARTRVRLGRLAFTTLVGLEVRRLDFHSLQGFGIGLPAGATTYEQGASRSITQRFYHQTTAGTLFDEGVGLGDRWSADFGARIDRLNVLGVEEPATTYPHLRLSWFPIRPGNSALQTFRVRAGWGRVGGGLGSENEVTSEVEGGADIIAVHGHLQMSVTGYGRHSHVANVFDTPFGPELISGTIANTGVIIAADLRLLRTSRLDWDATIGVWGNRNRVAGFPVSTNLGLQLIQNGYPIASYFAQPILGYRDANADGVIEPSEVQLGSPAYAGNPFPTQGATLSSSLRFSGGLRAGLVLEYRAGNQLFDETEVLRCQFQLCAGVNTRAPLVDQAAAAVATSEPQPYFSNAAFLKVRELSVSIVAPERWARTIRCSGATLTVAGRNLLTWTSYRGLDPEANSSGAVGLQIADLFTQPPVRTVAARVDLAF